MKSPRTWVKKIVCALSIFAVGATTVTPAIYAQDDAKAKEEAAAIQDVQSYIAIEQTSGKILMQNNQDEVRGIASMSKMISQYLILEAIKNGKVGLTILPPLVINKDNGEYTDEVLKMFE